MARSKSVQAPGTAELLGDPDALAAYKRSVFEKIEIRKPRGGYEVYTPHSHQEKAHFPGRPLTHQMLACGRRGGKTLFAVAEIIAMAGIEGTATWVGAPTYSLTDRAFQPVFRALCIDKIFGVGPRTARNTTAVRHIEMPWGAVIEGKSAERPASSKGASLDLFVDDECAEHDESYFTEYVGPGLADRRGKAIFTSTPLGLTWFHDYFKRGLNPKFQRMGWQSHTWKSEENPHLDKDWLHQQRLVVPDHVWRQEYLAEFLARSGLIWDDYRDEYFDGPNGGHLFNPNEYSIDPGWVHIRGIDIGSNHPTACVWAAVDPSNNVWVYDEYLSSGLHQEHAAAIAAKTVHPVMNSFISWEANVGDGKGGETVLQIYRNAGIYCSLAPKDLELRVDAVASYMRSALQDAPTHPAIFISDRCTALRDQIKKYRHKDLKPNAEVRRLTPHRKGKGDDLCDALGHAVVTKPQYLPNWLGEPDEDRWAKRYGYQNSAFMRRGPSTPFIGISGLGTIPRPGVN